MSKRTTSKRVKKPKKLQPNKQMQDAVMKLVLGLATGSQDEVTVPINLRIPRGLFETYKAAAAQWRIPLQDMLENAVKHGLSLVMMNSLPNEMKQNEITPLDLAQAGGIDMSQVKEGLSKVAGLVQELNELQRQADALTGTDTTNTL